MNRLLGNRGNADEGDEVANYNECVAEIKKENPYIGHLALQQEAMKRVALQRRAAKQDNTQKDAKEDFAPQRIAFRRRTRASQKKESNSPSQSLSRSFIGFLSSSTNTAKTSNRTVVESQENNVVMAGRRTSTYNEEDAVHATAYAMRDIELSDSDDDTSNNTSKNSRRSSLSRRLSSLRGTMMRRQSASRRRSSTNSSISTLQRHSSDLSKEDSTIEKSLESKSVDSKTDDDEKPQHKPQPNSDNAKESGENMDKSEKEEEEIMDFVEEFLAKGGRVRRTSLFSVEENKTCGESVSKSITSLGDGSSSHVAADGSLICGWGRGSLNESELIGADGEDLICNWDSRQSFLSNSSAPSNSDVTPERKQLPREINVGNNKDDR